MKIAQICLEQGICPVCMLNALESAGIDTFSSVEKMLEVLKIAEFPEAKNPFSFENSWMYFCNEHNDDEFDYSQLDDLATLF